MLWLLSYKDSNLLAINCCRLIWSDRPIRRKLITVHYLNVCNGMEWVYVILRRRAKADNCFCGAVMPNLHHHPRSPREVHQKLYLSGTNIVLNSALISTDSKSITVVLKWCQRPFLFQRTVWFDLCSCSYKSEREVFPGRIQQRKSDHMLVESVTLGLSAALKGGANPVICWTVGINYYKWLSCPIFYLVS